MARTTIHLGWALSGTGNTFPVDDADPGVRQEARETVIELVSRQE